jgi:integrase
MASIRKRTWTTSKGEKRQGFCIDYFDRQGTRQRRQFESRGEANEFRITVENEVRSGTYRPKGDKVTLAMLAETYLEHCRGRMARGERMTRRNLEVYEGHIRNYICPDPAWHARKHAKAQNAHTFFDKGLGSCELMQLTVGMVNKFADDLRVTGLSVATRRKIIGTLQVILNYGAKVDLVTFNAAAKVEVIGRRAEANKRVTPPSKEVMRELIELADDSFRTILKFATATGLRAGELHALRWRHIDLGRGEVSVETRVDPYRSEDLPKTLAGVRTIPLGEGMLADLRAWRSVSRFSARDDLVFPNKEGKYTCHDNMVKRKFLPLFVQLKAKWAGEGRNEPVERFNWHALRHFAISCWIEIGLPPKTVQTFAGHSSLQVTMDRYGHLFRSDRHKEAMDAIAAQLNEPGRPSLPFPMPPKTVFH